MDIPVLGQLNWVDLVILALLLGAAINGAIQGAAVQLFSYAGFGLGLVIGARLGPLIARFIENPAGKIVAVTLALFGTASLLGTIGRYIGAKTTWGVLQLPPLKMANSFGGLGVALLATLIGVWLIGGLMAQVGLGQVTAAFQESRIMRVLTDRLPPAPSVFSAIQRTFLPTGFPPVFAELEPSPAPEVAVDAGPEVRAAIEAARTSVLKITSTGCGQRKTTGSGFIAGDGLVITNAHVVAGVDQTVVDDPRGRSHPARVIFFDPEMDLAILRTSGLTGRALALVRSEVNRGQQGAVLGFPGGGPFEAEPGAVRGKYDSAVGRDIYSRSLVAREVYQLDAEVRAGNSGGPFITSSGDVAGVVFASSLVNDDVAYALTSTSVAPKLDQARARTIPVDTGPCLA
ncbi:MAG: MarP family serine protease [Actinomycetota bacterium]